MGCAGEQDILQCRYKQKKPNMSKLMKVLVQILDGVNVPLTRKIMRLWIEFSRYACM